MTLETLKTPDSKTPDANSNQAIKRQEQLNEARRIEAERKRQEELAAQKILSEQTVSKDNAALQMEQQRKQTQSTQDLPNLHIIVGMSPEALNKAVTDVHDAAFATTLGVSSPETKKLLNILATCTESDRKALELQYEQQYPGHSLREDLKHQLGADSTDYVRADALLKRKDGQADEVGQIQVALARLDNSFGGNVLEFGVNMAGLVLSKATQGTFTSQFEGERRSAENDIMKTLASLDADGIKKLLQQNRDLNSNQELSQAILSNPNISPECKQAVNILLKGSDRSTQDTLDLAQLGINSKRADIFSIAFQNASPEARKQFKDNNGLQQLSDTFSGFDLKIANDYLELGRASITTLVDGNTHWYHTNQDSIATAVKNASPEERDLYSKGKELSAKNSDGNALSDDDRKALEFYTNAHQALVDARNSDREVVLWESQLLGGTTLEQNMLKTHSDGYLTTFNWNLFAGHKRSDLLAQVDNMSEDDWKRLQNPQEREKLVNDLSVISSEAERNQVRQIITDKANAATFEESKKIGRRSMEQFLADGGDKLEAIANMTQQERDLYKNDEEYRNRIDKAALDGISSVHRLDVAKYLLQHPETSESVKQVLLDSTKVPMEDPAVTATKIEQAFKEDPSLLQRIKDTQAALKNDRSLGSTDNRTDDVLLTRFFEAAVDGMARTADPTQPMITISREDPARNIASVTRPANFDDFQKSLWETGKLDLQHRLQLDKFSKDPLARYKDLAAVSEEERQQIYKIVPGPANNFFTITDDEKRLVEVGIKNNGFSKVDEWQSKLIAPGRTDEQRKNDFSELITDFSNKTPAEKQNFANEYFSKTGKLFSLAVLDLAPEADKWRLRELITPAEINTRQVVLDARTDRSDHNSVMDNLIDNYWDASRISAEQSCDNLNKFLIDHKKELDALDPATKQKFNDAVENYKKAEKEYIDSKGKLAETFVDATITIAAIGGAVFTGGTSLTLLQAIGVGAAGAAYRTAAMKIIQGSDFDASPENIARQAFKGSTAALLGFIGPEQLGLNGFVKVGEQTATRIAGNTIAQTTKVGLEKEAFKEGVDVAKVVSERFANVPRQAVIAGSEDSEATIQKVVTEVMSESATTEEKQLFANALRSELKEQTVKSIRDKVISEADKAALSVSTGVISNTGTEVLSTVVGLDDPKTLVERMANGAVSGAGGALLFHGIFRIAGGTISSLTVGKDSKGLFAGENTLVRMSDGSIKQVRAGETHYFKEGETVVVPRGAEDVVYTYIKPDKANVEVTSKQPETIGDLYDVLKSNGRLKKPITILESKVVEPVEPNLAYKTEVVDGKVTKMVTSDGKEFKYTYSNGELSEVTYPSFSDTESIVARKTGEGWEYFEAKTQEWCPLTNELSVDKNGSFISKNPSGDSIVREGDGTTSLYKNGHLFTVLGVDAEQQTARLKSLIDSKFAGNSEMQKRMHNWMDMLQAREFQMRNVRGTLPESEVALTFKEVTRLLSSDEPGGLVPPAMRAELAEQILYHAAHPSLIEQGQFPTCNTTTIENRDFTRTPSDMAHLIVEVALTGKYQSKNGVVDMTQFKIDNESAVFGRTQKFGPENTDGVRSLASQIAQETMVNSYWQTATTSPTGQQVEAGTLVYKRVYPADFRSNDSGMRVVNSKTDEVYTNTDGPQFDMMRIEEASKRIGKNSSLRSFENIGWEQNEFVQLNGKSFVIDSPENLRKALREAQSEGQLPIVIAVNPTHPLISGAGSVFRALKTGEAGHVVTIRRINDDGTIELINQYARKQDHVLDKSLTAEQVFETMNRNPSAPTNSLLINSSNFVTSGQFLDIPAYPY